MDVKLMRLKAVTEATGLKSSWIYNLMNNGEFPQSVKLGPRSRAWRSDEIQSWILSRPRANANQEAA